MRVIVKCRHPGLENEIITCEMLSNQEPRLKRDPQGLTERTLAVRTLSDSCFVDIETGVGWWGYAFFCMRFSTFIHLITDDINQLSFLTWSTSRYRFLRDLHTFGHPNKSRSLGNIGKVAFSVTPSACPLKCFVAISPLWDTSKG